jgi:hypothetical protein
MSVRGQLALCGGVQRLRGNAVFFQARDAPASYNTKLWTIRLT